MNHNKWRLPFILYIRCILCTLWTLFSRTINQYQKIVYGIDLPKANWSLKWALSSSAKACFHANECCCWQLDHGCTISIRAAWSRKAKYQWAPKYEPNQRISESSLYIRWVCDGIISIFWNTEETKIDLVLFHLWEDYCKKSFGTVDELKPFSFSHIDACFIFNLSSQ